MRLSNTDSEEVVPGHPRLLTELDDPGRKNGELLFNFTLRPRDTAPAMIFGFRRPLIWKERMDRSPPYRMTPSRRTSY